MCVCATECVIAHVASCSCRCVCLCVCRYLVLSLVTFFSISNPFRQPQSKTPIYHIMTWLSAAIIATIPASEPHYREVRCVCVRGCMCALQFAHLVGCVVCLTTRIRISACAGLRNEKASTC